MDSFSQTNQYHFQKYSNLELLNQPAHAVQFIHSILDIDEYTCIFPIEKMSADEQAPDQDGEMFAYWVDIYKFTEKDLIKLAHYLHKELTADRKLDWSLFETRDRFNAAIRESKNRVDFKNLTPKEKIEQLEILSAAIMLGADIRPEAQEFAADMLAEYRQVLIDRSRGGSAKTAVKQKAAAENGKNGGRPPKPDADPKRRQRYLDSKNKAK